MYSEIFFTIYFYELKMSMSSVIFINKPRGFLKVMVLVFQLKNRVKMFQSNESSCSSLVLKTKEQKAI